MPSRSMLMTILWTVGVLAIVARVPQARTLVFGP